MWPPPVLTVRRRQQLTRLLCSVTLFAHLLLLPLWLVGLVVLTSPTVVPEVAIAAVIALAVATLIHASCALTLAIWRTCDECGFHLYRFGGLEGVTGQVSRLNVAPRPVDYRAKVWLNSYWLGALKEQAFDGQARCIWCGHLDARPSDPVC